MVVTSARQAKQPASANHWQGARGTPDPRAPSASPTNDGESPEAKPLRDKARTTTPPHRASSPQRRNREDPGLRQLRVP